ncbi:hypothetical protein Pmani_030618 [Petrolisthes manimaculis]|uniref:Uncharacterized protein n=1 Tax=Petrolisthes manimaculis TaxID=1843537 RepID=A0AAE1TVR2_9EUCA|nr:hypothetical protein Pmani_030618 [Petrolisthes manimaculis]
MTAGAKDKGEKNLLKEMRKEQKEEKLKLKEEKAKERKVSDKYLALIEMSLIPVLALLILVRILWLCRQDEEQVRGGRLFLSGHPDRLEGNYPSMEMDIQDPYLSPPVPSPIYGPPPVNPPHNTRRLINMQDVYDNNPVPDTYFSASTLDSWTYSKYSPPQQE